MRSRGTMSGNPEGEKWRAPPHRTAAGTTIIASRREKRITTYFMSVPTNCLPSDEISSRLPSPACFSKKFKTYRAVMTSISLKLFRDRNVPCANKMSHRTAIAASVRVGYIVHAGPFRTYRGSVSLLNLRDCRPLCGRGAGGCTVLVRRDILPSWRFGPASLFRRL